MTKKTQRHDELFLKDGRVVVVTDVPEFDHDLLIVSLVTHSDSLFVINTEQIERNYTQEAWDALDNSLSQYYT